MKDERTIWYNYSFSNPHSFFFVYDFEDKFLRNTEYYKNDLGDFANDYWVKLISYKRVYDCKGLCLVTKI